MIFNRPRPKLGDTRLIYKFCWFPRRVGDVIVWWQYVRLTQRFDSGGYSDSAHWITLEVEVVWDV